MKSIVVYDTSYGNTKQVADIIQSTLKKSGIETDIFYIKNAKNLNIKDCNLLILGSPTKFYTMSFAFNSFLSKLKSEDWTNKPFVTFDTENPENIQKMKTGAAEKIAEKLAEKKMNQIMPPLKVLVKGQKGPLVEGETEKIAHYTGHLVNFFENLTQGGK
jgi:flavodoxin